jgi:pimeloyl-ACP methyl ester carboxylesterase/hemoglobin-like flavoprotein
VLFAELAPLRDVLVSSSAPSAAIAPDAVLLSECLGRIWERIDAFTEDLYARLFGTYPELRTLFPGNMRDQRAKLAHALKLTVEGLRTPERLRSSLIELGRRHAAYGIAETELARLGPVLLSALKEADRDNWSEELEAAWLRGWHMILESMRLGYSHSEETLWSAARSVAQTDVTVEPESFQLPRVHYATSGEAQLAWHEFGKGARDIVMVPPWLSHLEMPWRHPEYAAFLRGMGRLGRAVRYDRRGAGLSDRDVASLGGDDLSDLLAVMDAASVKDGILFAPYDAARLALELSVAEPARVRGLVLYGATLKTSRDDECRFGTPREMLDARAKSLAARWGEEALLDLVAPSRQKDASFRHFWGQYMRMALTPRRAVRELERVHSLDLRALAQACTVPALVLHRAGDRNVPVAGGTALAEQLQKGTFVELAGEDHLTFLGDTSALLKEVERFAVRL